MARSYYGIEAGGTKFVCAWGSDPHHLYDRIVIPTTTPEETLQQVIAHIRFVSQKTALSGIGAAVFGPIGLNAEDQHYGYITSTPKQQWRYTDFVGILEQATDLPVTFNTDVNVTAMGEYFWGAGKGLSDFIYMTVGTGIGAGAIVNGKLCHGALHPEMGHILVPKLANDHVESVCDYHAACLEGLASGPAIQARWDVKDAMLLPQDHLAWEMEADYLAAALMNYTLCLSPKRIIMGGGVMQQTHLFPLIRKKLNALLAGYVNHRYLDNMDAYVVPPLLKNNAGVLGAIALATVSHAEVDNLAII